MSVVSATQSDDPDHPTAGHPTAGHPTAGHPTADHPTADHPTAGHPTAGHPTAGHPTAGHPTAGHPTADHPTADHPTAGHPTAGQPAEFHRASDEWLNHLLWDVYSRTTAIGETALSATPLSFAGIGVLGLIIARPGITTAEIARNKPVSQQAISQVTLRLEKLGFVERRLGAGRGVALHATPAGLEAHAHAEALELAFERHVQELIGAERYEQLCRLLEQTRAVLAGPAASDLCPR